MFALLRIITGTTRMSTHSKKVDLGSDDIMPNPMAGRKLPAVTTPEKVSQPVASQQIVDTSQFVTMSHLDSVVDKLTKLIDQRVARSSEEIVDKLAALIESKLGDTTIKVNPTTKNQDGDKGAKPAKKGRK